MNWKDQFEQILQIVHILLLDTNLYKSETQKTHTFQIEHQMIWPLPLILTHDVFEFIHSLGLLILLKVVMTLGVTLHDLEMLWSGFKMPQNASDVVVIFQDISIGLPICVLFSRLVVSHLQLIVKCRLTFSRGPFEMRRRWVNLRTCFCEIKVGATQNNALVDAGF